MTVSKTFIMNCSNSSKPSVLYSMSGSFWPYARNRTDVANAQGKLSSKKADWIVANDVSGNVMGGSRNRVHLVSEAGVEDWPEAAKEDIARHLITRIAQELE